MSRPKGTTATTLTDRRAAILAAVDACGGNMSAAARLLGCSQGTVWDATHPGRTARRRPKGCAVALEPDSDDWTLPQ